MRRVKKQEFERRRRQCISEKMTELNDLAMSLVGGDVVHKDKENMPPTTPIQPSTALPEKSVKVANVTSESGYHGSFASCLQQQSHNQPNFSADTDVTFTPIRRLLDGTHHHLSLSQFLNISETQDCPLDLSIPKRHDKGRHLWRPYET
ncbi:unnamed protein product [Mesocestoides corti]|uniref:BHLH domain-containing protein n=2 Tax=Mesocestoides corti TaxID=53468 RepID=A0A0R3U9T5_MESCO|nr:unnamed protein product [Mesocestoides corti]